MTQDLLTRIQQELQQRMDRLRPAVDESDRLQADLQALDAQPESPVALNLAPGPPAALEPSAPVVCFPATRAHVRTPTASPRLASLTSSTPLPARPRTRMVSSKVSRLMLTPRRPALERPDIPRIGASTTAGRDPHR
jgi:hypothetical protein